SRARKRGSTPGPQSRRSRPLWPSIRYPDCAPPGLGQAGEQPTTVSFTFLYCPSVAHKIRVVIAKPGLDGHDRGAKIIARALRDAGMEVIYTGLHQTPEQIVETAIEEDADAVGISILSGAHMTLVPRILALLREQGAEDLIVVVGGTIPNDDVIELMQQGVAAVFTPGAPTSEIVEFLRARVPV
ncbi:MAG: methylmalonyl-CoA mutase, C-terminal domain, partial [Gaiellales bacterium]|nr:methylmalonyl-CoA mutase, C-terminal domain [Gaiellales bacterium]